MSYRTGALVEFPTTSGTLKLLRVKPMKQKGPSDWRGLFVSLARPERFELPTFWFVARHSIQLSYGRVFRLMQSLLAEREGFEPSKGF